MRMNCRKLVVYQGNSESCQAGILSFRIEIILNLRWICLYI